MSLFDLQTVTSVLQKRIVCVFFLSHYVALNDHIDNIKTNKSVTAHKRDLYFKHMPEIKDQIIMSNCPSFEQIVAYILNILITLRIYRAIWAIIGGWTKHRKVHEVPQDRYYKVNF